MHELSIAESLIKIIGEEMNKHGLTKLLSVQIIYGQISAIVPEALETAFEVLAHGTPFCRSQSQHHGQAHGRPLPPMRPRIQPQP